MFHQFIAELNTRFPSYPPSPTLLVDLANSRIVAYACIEHGVGLDGLLGPLPTQLFYDSKNNFQISSFHACIGVHCFNAALLENDLDLPFVQAVEKV